VCSSPRTITGTATTSDRCRTARILPSPR
jgi:hypothetical protein